MSQVITPTIGRKLWYYPSKYDYEPEFAGAELTIMEVIDGQPCDANICYVHNDYKVNVTVADHVGDIHSRRHVPLVQPGGHIPPMGGYATWMPYQIEAALRHATPAGQS